MLYGVAWHLVVLMLLIMKTVFSETATILFLFCLVGISVAPVVRAAPAIYFDASIYEGGKLMVTGVGFTPGATITFNIGGEAIQTVPNPLVADSSGGFTGLLLTGKLGENIYTITATDGKTITQATLTVNEHNRDRQPPEICTGGISPYGTCCVASQHGLNNCIPHECLRYSADFFGCCEANRHFTETIPC
jgi:hypothetical protein